VAKLIAFVSTAGLIFFLLKPGGPVFRRTLDAPDMLHEIRDLNELVTVRYTVQKVVGMNESKSPLGSEKILLMVQAKVLAGVDLSSLTQSDVSMLHKHSARVRLGAPRIFEAFLDEKFTQVWDRSITWWTPWVSPSLDLEHKVRMQAIEDVKASAVQMGILEEARKNAQMDIRKILNAFGIDKLEFQETKAISGNFPGVL
jgi:hypothetical protein